MGKPFRCKLGNHSYHYMDPNFTKICKLCGHKFDPNNKTIIEPNSCPLDLGSGDSGA